MEQHIDSIHAAIAANSKPELAQGPGQMVYQVWNDGEVTLQKCGDLLWQRTLHCDARGKASVAVAPEWFPSQYNGYGYIFTDREGAYAVREAILAQTEVQ